MFFVCFGFFVSEIPSRKLEGDREEVRRDMRKYSKSLLLRRVYFMQ